MADFRKVESRVWEDEWFYEQDSDGKVLWFYLITNQRASVAGIYRLPRRTISFETGLSEDVVYQKLDGFQAAGKIMYADEIMWVKKLRDYQETESPAVQKRIHKDFTIIREGAVKQAYAVHYGIDEAAKTDENAHSPNTVGGQSIDSPNTVGGLVRTETCTETETETVYTVSHDDKPVLEVLSQITNYPFDAKRDSQLLSDLRKTFPGLDALEVVRQYAVWVLDHPIGKKDSPRGRLRNFFKQQEKWEKERQSRHPQPVSVAAPAFVPTYRDSEDAIAEMMENAPFPEDED